MDKRPTVIIEAPTDGALIDFLDVGTVEVVREKRAGKWVLSVVVKLDSGDGSTWTELSHAFPCPVVKQRR